MTYKTDSDEIEKIIVHVDEKLAVLRRALIDGYEIIDESGYDIFDSYAKASKLAPYEEF